MALYETLKELCAVRGISGREDAVRELILKKIEGFHAGARTDNLGNLIVEKKGADTSSRKLLLSAHMDEVGFIITHIEKDGMLRFAPVGGISPSVAAGRRVRVGEKALPGVIGVQPVHLLEKGDDEKYPKLSEMLIDIGAKDGEEARQMVRPGDMVTFDSEPVDFGENRLRARAIDDRAGCALLVELIRSELPYDCTFCFSVQEETGCTGAKAAGVSILPDLAIVVEGTTAGDVPEAPEHKVVCRLGAGPVLSFMDKGAIYDRVLYDRAAELAAERGLQWQTKEGVCGANESRSLQTSGTGVRVLAVSLPVRYLHSAQSVADLGDLDATLALLRALIEEFLR